MNKKFTYTSGEIAKILDISDRTARAYLRDGKIPARQNPITGRWKISKEDLLGFMKQYQLTPKEVEFQPRILVVDDEPAIIEAICKTFQEKFPDWVIDTTTSGYDALIRLGAEAPDLLILDICMPETDGPKILEAVRTSEQTASVKVLVITGYVEMIDEMLERGADASLEKPFSADDLLAAASKLLVRPAASPS